MTFSGNQLDVLLAEIARTCIEFFSVAPRQSWCVAAVVPAAL